jgi:hypothetical protein
VQGEGLRTIHRRTVRNPSGCTPSMTCMRRTVRKPFGLHTLHGLKV